MGAFKLCHWLYCWVSSLQCLIWPSKWRFTASCCDRCLCHLWGLLCSHRRNLRLHHTQWGTSCGHGLYVLRYCCDMIGATVFLEIGWVWIAIYSLFFSGSNSYAMLLWDKHRLKEPLIQGLHATSSVSSIISPFIIQPFIVDLDVSSRIRFDITNGSSAFEATNTSWLLQ